MKVAAEVTLGLFAVFIAVSDVTVYRFMAWRRRADTRRRTTRR
jgi:hypothetical protein